MKLRSLFTILLSLSMVAACEQNITLQLPEPEIEKNPTEQTETATAPIRLSMDVTSPLTKVTFNDNIDPLDGIGSEDTFSAEWEAGDKLVAIRWPEDPTQPITEMEVLVATEAGPLVHFEGSGHFKNLTEGEKFVIVHGDFVMGDSDDPRALSFPISEHTFEKASGFPFAYVDGEIVKNKTLIEFGGQDGTLKCLKEHEYMVSDAYIHLQNLSDGTTEAIFCANRVSDTEEFEPESIDLKHVCTIIRLQAFFPENYFLKDGKLRESPLAMSLRIEGKQPVFNRYFRMHPDSDDEQVDGLASNYYLTDSNNESERNPYLRIDFHRFDPRIENRTATDRLRSWRYNDGYFVVGYFAVASKPVALNGSSKPADFKVAAYTDSRMYVTNKTYTIKNKSMAPGNIIPLTINLGAEQVFQTSAITLEGVGVTFAPGLVYASRADENSPWTYGIATNQGEYAGPGKQSSNYGEYFVWGSIDPTEAARNGVNGKRISGNNFKDVASLVEIGGKSGLFSMLTKAEVDRVLASAKAQTKNEAKLGYYFYTPREERTMHKAPGSQNPDVLKAAGKYGTDVSGMAASLGFWLGTTEQPAYEDQDLYVFLPNAMQMNNKATVGNGIEQTEFGYYSPDFSSIDATGDDKRLVNELDVNNKANIMKFSTHTREQNDDANAYRLQIWIAQNRWNWSGIPDESRTGNSMNNTNAADKTFARPIRPVIF